MSKQRPRIADVQCRRLKFEPGDRLFVKVYHPITKDERKKLLKAVQKFAGTDVEVFIYDATQMEISLDKADTKLIRSS